MKCAYCDNDARYIDETGAMTCSLCPLKMRRDSIRLADVPSLLAWARLHAKFCPTGAIDDLRCIIGKPR